MPNSPEARAAELGMTMEQYRAEERAEYADRLYNSISAGMTICRYCGPDCRCTDPDAEEE